MNQKAPKPSLPARSVPLPRPKAAKRPPAVRDNVLGRRPSKTDPLGEQPGTVGHNPEQVGPPPSPPVKKPGAGKSRR